VRNYRNIYVSNYDLLAESASFPYYSGIYWAGQVITKNILKYLSYFLGMYCLMWSDQYLIFLFHLFGIK